MLMLLATRYSLLLPGYIMKHEKHIILALNTVLSTLSLSLSLSLSTKFCPLDRGRPFFLVLVQNFDARGLALAKIKLISLLCMVNGNKTQKTIKFFSIKH